MFRDIKPFVRLLDQAETNDFSREARDANRETRTRERESIGLAIQSGLIRHLEKHRVIERLWPWVARLSGSNDNGTETRSVDRIFLITRCFLEETDRTPKEYNARQIRWSWGVILLYLAITPITRGNEGKRNRIGTNKKEEEKEEEEEDEDEEEERGGWGMYTEIDRQMGVEWEGEGEGEAR